MKKFLYHDELAPNGHLFDLNVKMNDEWVDSPAKLKSFAKSEKEKSQANESDANKKAEFEAKIEAMKITGNEIIEDLKIQNKKAKK